MNSKKIVAVCIAFVILPLLFAQAVYGAPKDSSVNIVDYSHKLHLYLYTKTKSSKFGFSDSDAHKKLLYSPNEQTNIGFGFNYRFLGIGFAFNFRFINHDNDIYGHTSRFDWQGNFYGNKSVLDFTFYRYKSHYIDNMQEVFPGWKKGDDYYVRPDIINSALGVSYIYVFNNQRYSYKAAFTSTARQIVSAGSWFLGGAFFIGGVYGDSSMIPESSSMDYFPALKATNALAAGIKGGYSYTFVIKKYFYISATIGSTVFFGKRNWLLEKGAKYNTDDNYVDIQTRLAIGYNNDRWYAGLSGVTNAYSTEGIKGYDNLSLIYNYGNFKIFMGKRFNFKLKK